MHPAWVQNQSILVWENAIEMIKNLRRLYFGHHKIYSDPLGVITFWSTANFCVVLGASVATSYD